MRENLKIQSLVIQNMCNLALIIGSVRKQIKFALFLQTNVLDGSTVIKAPYGRTHGAMK